MPIPYYPLAHYPLCTLPQATTRQGYWVDLPPWTMGARRRHPTLAAVVLNLFVCVIAATCTMLHQDLAPSLRPTQHPCMPPHSTPTSSPPTPLHLIVISVLVINSLPRACNWASSQPPLRTPRTPPCTQNHSINTRKSPNPTPLGKVYKEPWLYPPPPSPTWAKEPSSVWRAQASHRLASRWRPFSIHSSNVLGWIV